MITCLDHIRNEYRFTYQGTIVYCQDEQEFVVQIAKLLNIANVYLSASCDSKHIALFKAF